MFCAMLFKGVRTFIVLACCTSMALSATLWSLSMALNCLSLSTEVLEWLLLSLFIFFCVPQRGNFLFLSSPNSTLPKNFPSTLSNNHKTKNFPSVYGNGTSPMIFPSFHGYPASLRSLPHLQCAIVPMRTFPSLNSAPPRLFPSTKKFRSSLGENGNSAPQRTFLSPSNRSFPSSEGRINSSSEILPSPSRNSEGKINSREVFEKNKCEYFLAF